MPNFVATAVMDDIDYIVCNNLETLLWLGNQLALEFHIPFQTHHSSYPTEIVFDLDPPSVQDFSLAVSGALDLKNIIDYFQLNPLSKHQVEKVYSCIFLYPQIHLLMKRYVYLQSLFVAFYVSKSQIYIQLSV